LAAPQIGVLERVAVVDISRDRRKKPRPGTSHGLIVLVNPEIISSEGLQIPREGCLSIPHLLADVRRAEKVCLRTLGENGEERTFDVEGFEALAVQHEVDHLNGKLFLDRVANVKTDLFRRQVS
jgi:peptide deformylase